MKNLSETFSISQTFPLSLTEHTKFIWKHPVVIVETFKVKVYLTVSRHYPAQPFCPVLVLAFAWQLFSSSHLRLAPFLESLIVLQLHNSSSKFWKSTVLDSAKPFSWIFFFCFYLALSIFSPRVNCKERVIALKWGISICPKVALQHWIVSFHKRVFPEWVEVERDIELQRKVQMKMIIPKQDKGQRFLLLQLNAQVPEEEDQKSLQKWIQATLSKQKNQE